MKIRSATQKDVPAISILIRGMARYHHKIDKSYITSASKQSITSYIGEYLKDKNRVVIVAEENKNLIGYIFGSIRIRPVYIRRSTSGYLDEMFVAIPYRNKGIGKKLLSKLIVWLKTKKIKDIVAGVDARNKTALVIWKKLGFHTHTFANKVEMGLNL